MRAALRADRTVEARDFIGPHDYPAAVTVRDRIGLDRGVSSDVGAIGVLDVRVLALVIATHQHRAAAGGARCVDSGITDQPHLRAEQMHAAAVGLWRGYINPPIHQQRACLGLHRDIAAIDRCALGTDDAARLQRDVPLRPQHDVAVGVTAHLVGVDAAPVPEHCPVNAHLAALRDDLPQIDRFALAGDLHLHAGRAGIPQEHALSRRENHLSVRAVDDPVVLDVRRHQINAATRGGSDRARIDDLARTCLTGEIELACEKIAVGKVQCGGNKPGHIHPRPLPDQDP